MGREISGLPDEEGLPVSLAQQVNGLFNKAAKRMMDSNDYYGSRVMREVILDEVNDLRRATLQLLRRLHSANGDNSRLHSATALHRHTKTTTVRHRYKG